MIVNFVSRKSVAKDDFVTEVPIYVRLRDGRDVDQVVRIRMDLNPNLLVASKLSEPHSVELGLIKRHVESEYCRTAGAVLSKSWLSSVVEGYYDPRSSSLVPLFERFIKESKVSEVRKLNSYVLVRALGRYEQYKRAEGCEDFELRVENVTKEVLQDIWDFFEIEYTLFYKYQHIYRVDSDHKRPTRKSENTLKDWFSRINTFLTWCVANKKCDKNPFAEFKSVKRKRIEQIALTNEELLALKQANIGADLNRHLEVFLYQIEKGCSVKDLSNVMVGSVQRYNRAIKDIFVAAGLTRLVYKASVGDVPLHRVASSKIAQATFLANQK